MFWRWRRHAVALWRHGRDAWHNCLLLATASNVNCWADVANHVIDCGKRVIRKISNAGSRASYGPYHGLELPNHGINVGIVSPQWRGKRSRQSRRMRNPQFYVSGKRPIDQVGDHKNIAYPRSVEEKFVTNFSHSWFCCGYIIVHRKCTWYVEPFCIKAIECFIWVESTSSRKKHQKPHT